MKNSKAQSYRPDIKFFAAPWSLAWHGPEKQVGQKEGRQGQQDNFDDNSVKPEYL